VVFVWHQLLLGVAVVALGGAALRVGAMAGSRGLERVLVAAPVGVAVAVVEALGLGLVGWGGSPVALVGAALATWLVARLVCPRPLASVRRDSIGWWRGRSRGERLAAGAVCGLGLAYVAFLLRYPEVGYDGVVYHLPEVVGWVQSGHPGSELTLIEGLPVGSYPLTGEVAIAWGTAISRSFVVAGVFGPLTLVLLLVSGWHGLRLVRAPRWAASLALAALATCPLVLQQLTGPNTDLPALAWLATAGALCAGAVVRRRAVLLAPALVAAALAVGTKTTVAPLALILLAATAWTLRRSLRPVLGPLLGGLALGLAAGGVWYLRRRR
jgi:hypothetical protein